jgi:multidrug efflux pump
MNLSEPFVRRPVATTLLTIGVALAGLTAYFRLPVSPLPQADYPTIVVSASMPGASPETMASSVATPLERHLGSIADVTDMTSRSSVGNTQISLQFNLSRDIDGAARDVQAAINAARADLPSALRSNPTYRKFNVADQPILILALTSDRLPQGELYDVAATVLQQKLSQIDGVGDVSVGGSSLPAVRVEMNPTALFKYGIGLEDVRAALAAANANSPKGIIESDKNRWQLYSNDRATAAAEYQSLVIAYRNGSAVRLSDVASVTDSVEDTRNLGLSNGTRAVIIIISRQPGANIISTVDRIKAVLPQLEASLPGGAKIDVAIDRSTTIRASLHDVEVSLAIAVALVILVVFLFLRDPRATAIPSVAVPISLIGTFGVMYLLDYSLDNLSLMALTIATGFVVDDAIVVMENIVRHMEAGVPRFKATLLGVREVGFTVLSMSVSLIAVFIPVLLMGGFVGRLFREFAVTLSVAILMSMVVSLTTTPSMCARLLSNPHGQKHGRLYRWIEDMFQDLVHSYERTLAWVLDRGLIVLIIFIITVGLNVWLFTVIPKGLFPQQDTGRLFGFIQADQSISFQAMSQKFRKVIEIIGKDPDIQNIAGTTGAGGRGGGTNSARMFADLKPLGQRKASAMQVVARLRPQLMQIPGAMIFLTPAQEFFFPGTRQSNASYQYTLQGDNLQDLRTWTPKLLEALKTEPILQDLNSDQEDKGLETDLIVDRDAAARLGITMSQIDNTLYDAFGQRQVSTIYRSLNQYHVVMTVAPQFWQDPAALEHIYISTSGGAVSGTQATNAVAGTVATTNNARSRSTNSAAAVASDSARNAQLNAITARGRGGASAGQAVSTRAETMIPLSAVAHYGPGTTPLSVNHQGQFVASTISFNVPEGTSLSQALAAVNRQIARIHLPSSIHGGFQGSAQSFQQSLGNELVLIAAAIVAIYLVLGILYESLWHPFTILSTLPSAGLGAVLALLLFNTEFSLIALIGVFLLIGIVKKNAIMMIDFAIAAERDQQLSPRDAIFRAAVLRFRPILMTTMAALLGAVPLALGLGNGAELRRPLGIAIVGGLLVSQVITLYSTPVIYLFVDRLRLRFERRKAERNAAHAAGTPATTLKPVP